MSLKIRMFLLPLCLAASTQAAVLTVGSQTVSPLLPPGSTIDIPVSTSGGTPISGFTLQAIIADNNIATPGPRFTGEANFNTVLFAPFSNKFSDVDFSAATAERIDAQFLLQNTGDSTAAAGDLVIFRVDVSSLLPFTSYTVTLNPDETALVGDSTVTINAGTITVVPEPASAAVLGLAGLALLRRRRA